MSPPGSEGERQRRSGRACGGALACGGAGWHGALVALEVFPPTTLNRYRDEIWWEPPGFIR